MAPERTSLKTHVAVCDEHCRETFNRLRHIEKII